MYPRTRNLVCSTASDDSIKVGLVLLHPIYRRLPVGLEVILVKRQYHPFTLVAQFLLSEEDLMDRTIDIVEALEFPLQRVEEDLTGRMQGYVDVS